MAFNEDGYINDSEVKKLRNIAGDETYSSEEFLTLYDEVQTIYGDILEDQKISHLRDVEIVQVDASDTDAVSNLTNEQRNNYNEFIGLNHEQKTLLHITRLLDGMKPNDANDITVKNFQQFRTNLYILFGASISGEDKYFFDNSFTELAKISDEMKIEVEKFQTSLDNLELEVRVSQRHEDETNYGGEDEKAQKKKRRRTTKVERKEAKGKERQLMRNVLRTYLGNDSYEQQADVLDKVTNLLDETSMSLLINIYYSRMSEGVTSLDRDTIEDKLTEANYIAKGRRLDRKEKRQIVELYSILLEHGGTELYTTNPTSQPAEALSYLVKILRSNISLAHVEQATVLTQSVDSGMTIPNPEGGDPIVQPDTVITGNLIGDINYDGDLVNAPDPAEYKRDYKSWEKSWESVDKSLVMGTSLRKMMDDAEHFLALEFGGDRKKGRKQLIQNIVLALEGYTGEIGIGKITTDAELLALYKKKPYLLAATHQMLLDQGADARLILQYGVGNDDPKIPSYTDIIEARAAQQTVDLGVDELASVISPEQDEMIRSRLSDCFNDLIVSLEAQMAEDPEKATPEMRTFVSSLKQDEVAYINKWKINAFGAIVSTIKSNEGLGLGTSMNVRLNKNIKGFVQAISVSGGVFSDISGNVGVGVAVSFSANHAFGKKDQHSFYYGFGGGLGYGATGLVVGPYVAPGVEFQINAGRIANSLDAKSAQHIGLATNASLVGAGGTLYWSRDKLKGYNQAKASIEAGFSSVFTGLEEIDATSYSAIYDNLKEKYPKSQEDTLKAAALNMQRLLLPFAGRWEDMDERVKGKILDDISKRYALTWYNQKVEALGEGFSSLHLSQLGVGGQAVWALPIIGTFVFPTAGLTMKWYKESTYRETDESLVAIKEAQEKGYGAREVGKELNQDMVGSINMMFGLDDGEKMILESPPTGLLYIPKAMLSKDGGQVNLHIHPTMKQFVKSIENGTLQVNPKIPVTIMSTYRQGEVEYDLIIGAIGLEGTEQVLPEDMEEPNTVGIGSFTGDPSKFTEYTEQQEIIGQKAKLETFLSSDPLGQMLVKPIDQGGVGLVLTEKDSNLILTIEDGQEITLSIEDLKQGLNIARNEAGVITSFALTGPDSTPEKFEISYSIETQAGIAVGAEVSALDSMPILSDLVTDYINDASRHTELLTLRNTRKYRSQRQGYRDAIEDNRMEEARGILQVWKDAGVFSLDPSVFSLDDLRGIDAAMSIVQLTKRKIVDNKLTNNPNQRGAKAITLWNAIEGDLKDTIPGWGTATISKDDLKNVVASIATGATSYDRYHQYFYHIMKGDGRTDGKNKMKKVVSPTYELFWLLASNKYILETRTATLKKKLISQEGLSQETFDAFAAARKNAVSAIGNNNTYTVSPSRGYGMVLGYSDKDEIEEKYIPHPQLVTGAETVIDNAGLKRYFLENLPDDSPILGAVIAAFNGIDRTTAIQAILDGEYEGRTITSTFKLGFYGKCFNETITLEDLVISLPETPGEKITHEGSIDTKETFCSDGVFINSVGTESMAVRREKQFTLGWIGGDPTRIEEEEIIREEEGTSSTNPGVSDTELANNIDWDNVTYKEHTVVIDGIDVQVMGYVDANDPSIIYYQDNNTGYWYKYIPGTPPIQIIEIERFTVPLEAEHARKAVTGAAINQITISTHDEERKPGPKKEKKEKEDKKINEDDVDGGAK